MDVLDWAELGFPKSLPEFQELFPDDVACASCLDNSATTTHGNAPPRLALANT